MLYKFSKKQHTSHHRRIGKSRQGKYKFIIDFSYFDMPTRLDVSTIYDDFRLSCNITHKVKITHANATCGDDEIR